MKLAEVTPAMRPYEPFGACKEIFYNRAEEILVSGPAGTGKSRAILEKMHACMERWPGARALIVRKTREALTEAALVTYEEKVLPERHPALNGPQRRNRQHYEYPNSSVVVVGGMDKAGKIMSTEFDFIFPQEAIELTEHDWESLTTRLRNGVMPFQQIVGDTNPDAPHHWLKQRCDRGATDMLESRHEDNPVLFDHKSGLWTAFGLNYIAKLDRLTGARRERLRFGRWAAAEGLVYEDWDRAVHLIDRFEIPLEWRRWWVVDFGYSNPFVWQAWAEDGDGRLYRYREIYSTQTLVEDHAARIVDLTRDEPRPVEIICDHDAEDRATLERKLGMRTEAAHKAVSPGIQAVQARLKPAGDGKPRIFYLRDSLAERDEALMESRRPCCTEEEYDGYVWPKGIDGKPQKEEPVKADDHGMDATRYLVARHDVAAKRMARIGVA